jgi:hypothetical protein
MRGGKLPLEQYLPTSHSARGDRVKLDAGGRLRSLILKALQPIAHLTDRSLAEHAAMTYEFLPPKKEECTGGLCIAGLSLLETIDVVLASYHSVRLLHDP